MGRLLISVLAGALAVAGCVAEAPGQPVAGPDDASMAPPTSPSRVGKAPSINSPELDVAGYENRICDLLTLAQLAPFAIQEPGKPRDAITGPHCAWNPPDTTAGARVDVHIFSKVGYGWEGVYERRGNFPFFEDAGEINGYPAVHIGATTIDVTSGTCSTTVGVSRELVFDAGVFVNVRSSPEYTNPCSVSDRVASLVIDTLKGGR